MVTVRNRRGRPLSFDREAVLERAMQTFWEMGFEATSIPVLTGAMGISAQSLYAAFGSKEALYREAIAFYGSTIGGYAVRALSEEIEAVDAIVRLLKESATTFGRTAGIPGCMVTTTPSNATSNPIAVLGQELRTSSVKAIEERLRRGLAEGHVADGVDVAGWARYVASVIQGMSIQARDGASAAALMTIATIASSSVISIRADASVRSGV